MCEQDYENKNIGDYKMFNLLQTLISNFCLSAKKSLENICKPLRQHFFEDWRNFGSSATRT